MTTGVLILQDGTVQLIGEVDYERLAPLVTHVGEQLREGAARKLHGRFTEWLRGLEPDAVQRLLAGEDT